MTIVGHESASSDDAEVVVEVEVATFALGGFWSAEVWFRGLAGVVDTRVGHLVGEGVLEVVEVAFDPAEVTYATLLDRFFGAHDPTEQFRESLASDRFGSVIFTHDEQQTVEVSARVQAESRAYGQPLTTEVRPAADFRPAADEQQQWLAKKGAYTHDDLARHVGSYESRLGRRWPWPSKPETIAAHMEQVAVRAHVEGVLSRLPEDFHLRWILGGLASLEERRDEISRADRTLLEAGVFAAMRGALKASLWQWCRADPAISCGGFDLHYLDQGDAASAHGCIDGDTAHVSVSVPFRWLTHVWARGLAAIDGELVLKVDGPADSADLDVVVAGWRQSGPDGAIELVTRRTSLHWDGDAWRLADTG